MPIAKCRQHSIIAGMQKAHRQFDAIIMACMDFLWPATDRGLGLRLVACFPGHRLHRHRISTRILNLYDLWIPRCDYRRP